MVVVILLDLNKVKSSVTDLKWRVAKYGDPYSEFEITRA